MRPDLKRAIDDAMIEWFERHADSAYPVCYGPLPGTALRDHLIEAITRSQDGTPDVNVDGPGRPSNTSTEGQL